MVDIKKYTDINLYELISVNVDATESELRKAYRKKALECHPDKNPDNPKAAELFQELSKALEILTDASARKAYDKILNAKKQAELRNKQLDSKRQKLKQDLEKRERDYLQSKTQTTFYTAKSDEEKLKEEIERLRTEGCKLLEEEQELMRQQIREERLKKDSKYDSSQYRIKIKWKSSKDDENNGGYDEKILQNFLRKYGDILALVMSPNKKGSALVEFKTKEGAEMAVNYEKGNLSNPLILNWVGKPPENVNMKTATTVTDLDYESLVLRQMRQAEERKRLIEQMMKEDVES